MFRIASALASAAAVVAAFVAIPSGPAGSATSCVAWASLPSRVSLAGQPVNVRATLHGSPACAGVTTDNGGTATLNGPGGSTSDFPLQWGHIGGTDTAPFYASFETLGTYRISTGNLQTYDASYRHIPFEWRPTGTVVKYAGRFHGVTHSGGVVRARLQYFAKYDWAAHADVLVKLQRRTDTGWQTVARKRTSGSGFVRFPVGSGTYRLVSATTAMVWSTAAGVTSSAV